MEKDPHENSQYGGFDRVGSIATNVEDGFTMTAVGVLLLARQTTIPSTGAMNV